MPRLPSLDDLGSRPVPVSRRQIVSNPGVGAIGNALEGFGDQTARIGQQMQEKDDRLSYAAAKSAVLKADVAARQELQDDPDYETWGVRYTDKMKAASQAAAGMIHSRTDRRLFEADAELDAMRGGAELAKLAGARRVNARVGVLDEATNNLQDVGQNAPDDGTREATIANLNELVNAARDRGDITPAEAVQRKRQFGQNYVMQRVENLRTQGDLDEAQRFFDAHRGALDPSAEMRMNEQLHDAIENRENLTIAEDVVHGSGASTGPSAASTGAVSHSQMVAITAQSESGSRERRPGGQLVTSPAGAQGMMQVMPATARNPGYGIRPWDGKTDEDRSRVGRDLLAALQQKYGDPAKAWAAYNWDSSGRKIDAAVAKYGDNWLDHTPKETQAYVKKNMEALGRPVGQGPAEHDLNAIYASIDERGKDWTPERREAVKAQAARLVDRDEGLLRRQQNDAFEGALAKADALGAGFTNVSQLGDAFYRASTPDQHRLRAMAEANAAPKEPPANGTVVRSLHVMAIEAPDKFAGVNLAQYKPFMTAGEFDEVSQSQARAKAQPADGAWNPRTGIQAAISWGKTFGGVPIKDGEDMYRVYRYMEARAREQAATNHGKPPTENDYQTFFREATQQEHLSRSFMGIDALAPDAKVRSYQAVSSSYKALITRQFKAQFGRNPTDAEVQQWFERMGEVLK